MTAPRRDETTMTPEADARDSLERMLTPPSSFDARCPGPVARRFLDDYRDAIEARVVSALSARGGDASEAEVMLEAERVVNEWERDHPDFLGWKGWDGLGHERFARLVRAGIALGRRHAVSPEAGVWPSSEAIKSAWAEPFADSNAPPVSTNAFVANALADAKREGRREVYDAIVDWVGGDPVAFIPSLREALAPFAPVPPAPKGVTLANGDTVRFDADGSVYRGPQGNPRSAEAFHREWPLVMRPTDTGDDFEKVKAFALALAEAPDGR